MFKKENFITSQNCKALQNQTKHFVGGWRYLHEQLHQHLPRGSKTVQVSGGKDKLLSCPETPWEIADEGESTCSETSRHLPAREPSSGKASFVLLGVSTRNAEGRKDNTSLKKKKTSVSQVRTNRKIVGGAGIVMQVKNEGKHEMRSAIIIVIQDVKIQTEM